MPVRRVPVVALAVVLTAWAPVAAGCDDLEDPAVQVEPTVTPPPAGAELTGPSKDSAVSLVDAAGVGYFDTRLVNRPRQRVPQTSDGVPGTIAPLIPFSQGQQRAYRTVTTRRIVPGVRFERFEITDFRGQFRGQLLRVDPTTRGLRIDYAGRKYVASVAPLGALLDRQAVAAVNGDFFDIGNTNAPLGVGRDLERGALHGVQEGWNAALYLDRTNTWRIGPISTTATVRRHPELHITTVNSPSVRPGQIGLYTGKWGSGQFDRVVVGQPQSLRVVVVLRGRVVANRTDFPDRLPPGGQLLVGHGRGAEQLAELRPRTPIAVRVRYAENPRVVLTGNTRILKNSERLTIDDVEMHPRTSVGIDQDTGEILMLVVDGRQSFSRGLTMVELANLMRELGAEDAINLDGGGSSTLMALTPRGQLTVQNSPSDGTLRPIPNGLQVLYSR